MTPPEPSPTEASTEHPGFGGLPAEFRDPDTADIAILPVPYDLTSSWKKGADRGPAALIEASKNMELYDIPTDTEVYRRGILTREPVVHAGDPEVLADLVGRAWTREAEANRFPVVIGGEHSVSIGAIRAAASTHQNLTVLQIDAHGDTRDSYDGSKFNHACVMARAKEWCSITQVGIRSVDIDELDNLDDDRVFYGHTISRARYAGSDRWMDDVLLTLDENVYVTIDLDAFDPALVPATGTPEPDGLTWYEVNELLERVCASRRVIGFDVVELLPNEAHWASDFLAAKLVYRFLSMIFAQRD
ncbi:MAG: agmatinase [Phycisphaerales bacterium]|nr:MAG: agmatinase [Phycisphaerales bacterium]